ncbi:VOC family protein [Pseudomonas sp. Pseusp122]|uniref:VOC family protein n=1 Tax=unclassified Pseudomonas TaxID=196821 RepID=UPI0039A40DD8
MYLDHANIVTPNLAATASFFIDVLGLTIGPRPNFQVPGCWLYSDGRPLIHLTQATIALPVGKTSPRIDHVALRLANLDELTALLARLKDHHADYQLDVRTADNEIQLWVAVAPGVIIEFIVVQ